MDLPRPGHRLTGEVEGSRRSFLLVPGTNRVGSRTGNEVVLPVPGVSRTHAELDVTPDGVRVRDLGSKNGVRVDGERVTEAVLSPGDRVRFGPVKLTLEQVPAGDAVLAIEIPRPPAPAAPEGSGSSATPTPGAPTRSPEAERWLPVVEKAVELLRQDPPDTAAVTAVLVRALGARGACAAVLRDRREPVVITAWGWLGEAAAEGSAGRPLDATLPALEAGPRPAPGEITWSPGTPAGDGTPAGPLVVRLGTADGCLALAIWEPSVEPARSLPLVRPVLRLLAAFAGEAAPERPPRRSSEPELTFPPGHILCGSPAMTALYRQMRSIAATELPVLLRGETGVGKELVARTIHLSSRRARAPLVTVNCAAIPENLLEAEMFGIGKGVATGVEAREGRFRLADGGTLFLDEVGEMPPALQAKLLRALEEKEIHPLGRRPVRVDVRVVAATNADLKRSAESGSFRPDLYYRLAGCDLEVPPLRHRREDVAAFVEHFGRQTAEAAGKEVRGVTWSALERLTAYPWPGNVRELRHTVQRLVHLCPEGGAVDSSLLPPEIVAGDAGEAAAPALRRASSLRLADHVEPLERRLVQEALRRTGGNRTRAAELLGMSRNGLAYKLKSLGLDD